MSFARACSSFVVLSTLSPPFGGIPLAASPGDAGRLSYSTFYTKMTIKLSQDKKEAPDLLAPLMKQLSDRHGALRLLVACLCKGAAPQGLHQGWQSTLEDAIWYKHFS